MRTFRFLIFLIVSFFCTTLFLSRPAEAQFFFVMENPLVGQEAPEFETKTLSGKKVSFNEFRDGQSVIVFFWATWCPTCGNQMKRLLKDADTLKKKGAKIVLINMGEDEKMINVYIKKYKLNYDMFLDKEEDIALEYNVIALPTIFFIDENGVVKAAENSLPRNYQKILFGKKLKAAKADLR